MTPPVREPAAPLRRAVESVRSVEPAGRFTRFAGMAFLLHDRPDSPALQALILSEAEAIRQRAEQAWRALPPRRRPDPRDGAFR
jgi:hypothetical protein